MGEAAVADVFKPLEFVLGSSSSNVTRKQNKGFVVSDQSGDGDSDRSASMEMERNSASKQAEMGSGDGENVAENNHETVSQN